MSRARFSFLVLFLVGCASTPQPGEYSSRELMEAACPSGFGNGGSPKTIRGSVWTKMKSENMSGQFPATVLVEYPARLAIEVTNLIGAPQAWLKMENGKTELKFTAANEKEYGKPETQDTLGGLPLELAPRLFAGGVPCPSDTKNKDIQVKQTPEGGLQVKEVDLRTRQVTSFSYSFLRYAQKPWVNEVRWEKLAKDAGRGAKSNQITIVREDPSGSDGAPSKWSASSAAGEIQVRWRDRNAGK